MTRTDLVRALLTLAGGDGRTDVAVFRPSTGEWLGASGSTLRVTWGAAGDRPVPGDYDGDGVIDIAVFRPSTGVWYLLRRGSNTSQVVTWGGAGDIPVPADYDGDGRIDVAGFRPSNRGLVHHSIGHDDRRHLHLGWSWRHPHPRPLTRAQDDLKSASGGAAPERPISRGVRFRRFATPIPGATH